MDHNTQYEPHNGNRASFCLGHPSHALQPEEVICRVCGALAAHTTLGIYQVQKLLGIGRSGRAYLAHHQRSGQPVTIKLSPSQTANPELWEGARREVRMTTALRHNSIRAVYSCGTWSPGQKLGEGSSPFNMQQAPAVNTYLLSLCQFIPGTLDNLTAYLQKGEYQRALYEQGSSPQALLVHVLQQIGMAIHAVHTRGSVHGAIIPGNILFTSYERAWLADFGLARLQPAPSPFLAPELYTAAQASQQGNVQAYWNAVHPASDQYMFAILCQQLFTQTLPRQDYETLQPVINRATHHKPERRYPSIEMLVQDLLMLTSRSGQRPKQTSIMSHSSAQLVSAGSSPTRGSGIRPGSSSSQNFTPLPAYAAGPMTPSLPATPLTPAVPLTAEDWEKRGDKLFALHEYEEALVAYHRAVEVHGEKAQIWLALGDTYFALGRHKEALMAYEQAMYLNPNDPQTWANRGTALDELGRHREALDCYERSEQLRSA